MKLSQLALVAAAVAALGACNRTPTQNAADNVRAAAENQADALQNRADNMVGAAENRADAMRDQASNITDAAENRADRMEAAPSGSNPAGTADTNGM